MRKRPSYHFTMKISFQLVGDVNTRTRKSASRYSCGRNLYTAFVSWLITDVTHSEGRLWPVKCFLKLLNLSQSSMWSTFVSLVPFEYALSRIQILLANNTLECQEIPFIIECNALGISLAMRLSNFCLLTAALQVSAALQRITDIIGSKTWGGKVAQIKLTACL